MSTWAEFANAAPDIATFGLERIEGRRLTFAVSVRDEHGLVAAGKVTRVVVDIDRFMDKAR